jgi:hypothetical protein
MNSVVLVLLILAYLVMNGFLLLALLGLWLDRKQRRAQAIHHFAAIAPGPRAWNSARR